MHLAYNPFFAKGEIAMGTAHIEGKKFRYSVIAKKDGADQCYKPDCDDTLFANCFAVYFSAADFLAGGDAIAVLFTCSRHNNEEFLLAKQCFRGIFKGVPYENAAFFTRDEILKAGRRIPVD